MSILKARTVDAEVQRKRFDNMHKAHINMTTALATVAEEKAMAAREVTRARAELASASRGAVLAARAANDRAAQVATLLEEVERLQGRPPPERAPVPFPDVAAGGVSGWADEAQVPPLLQLLLLLLLILLLLLLCFASVRMVRWVPVDIAVLLHVC